MAPAEYDYHLFDLDGTLVDTSWSYKRELFDRVGSVLGREFDDEQVTRLWHGLGGDRGVLLREWGLDPDAFWTVFDRHDDPVARAEATYLYDDAAAVGDLPGPVGLVTHCPAPITRRVLDHLDVRDWFDATVCCSAETGFKPDPAPVEAAVSALGASGRGALAGDSAGDVGAAWNAGLDAVHVERHDPSRRGRCLLADHRVTSVAEWWSRSASD